jgi:hypothetical protein
MPWIAQCPLFIVSAGITGGCGASRSYAASRSPTTRSTCSSTPPSTRASSCRTSYGGVRPRARLLPHQRRAQPHQARGAPGAAARRVPGGGPLRRLPVAAGGWISLRLPPALTVHTDRYDDSSSRRLRPAARSGARNPAREQALRREVGPRRALRLVGGQMRFYTLVLRSVVVHCFLAMASAELGHFGRAQALAIEWHATRSPAAPRRRLSC